MKIHFERRGGFTGIPLRAVIDSEELEPGEAGRLRIHVESCGFFDLPEKLAGPAHSADRFEYRVTIEDARRAHTVEVGGGEIPAGLDGLLQHLVRLARLSRLG